MSATRFYSLYTISSLHSGSGKALAAIDLPLSREACTDFPQIPATSLKGAFRARYARKLEADKSLTSKSLELFGDTDHGAGLAFLDARLLAFPVRSLQAVFYWVSCPLVLRRLKRDLLAFGHPAAASLPKIESFEQPEKKSFEEPVKQGKALLAHKLPNGGKLVLEDLTFESKFDANVEAWGKWFAALLPEEEALGRKYLPLNLVIVPDEDFADLVKRTTPVQARIKIDDESGTAENLWYEETMPPDSLFAFLIQPLARNGKSEDELLAALSQVDEGMLQLGGNKTVGQGWCRLTRWRDQGGKSAGQKQGGRS